MKKLDEIATDANRAIIERSEGSLHYKAPAIVSPEVLLSMTSALNELLSYAMDANNEHTENCSYVTTYDSKSLACDCYKAVIPETIARHLGGEVKVVAGNVVEVN